MKKKRSSLKANLTASQWLAFDMLNMMLKGPLPEFSLAGIPDGEIWKLSRANLARENLWRLLQKRVFVEFRTIEECSYDFKSIVRIPKNEGEEWVERRDVIFNLSLVIKPKNHLPPALDFESLSLRIKMEMIDDSGEWRVQKIIFIPQTREYLIIIFNGFSSVYEIA